MSFLLRSKFAVSFFIVFWVVSGYSQVEPAELSESSKACLECHAHYQNEVANGDENPLVKSSPRIEYMEFAQSVHSIFSCDDCHSPDYATIPHDKKLKDEYLNTCLDCHGGDAAYARLQFDEIAVQAANSIHAQRMGDAFKCEMCHNPHTNRLVADAGKYSLHQIVAFDNEICLSCHGVKRGKQDSEKEISSIHDWLPNQKLHFKHVRCIECHTPKGDTLIVSHQILPKEQAIRNCVECHSQNSLLQAKLYKYLSKESRIEDGIPATLKNDSYVIGSNRSILLNITSLVIFVLVLAAIIIHGFVRIVMRK